MDSSFQNHGLDESAFDDKGLSSLRTFDAFREYLQNHLTSLDDSQSIYSNNRSATPST